MESPPRVVVDLAPEPSSPMGQAPSPTGASISPRSPRPPMVRTRSKSEAELPTLRTPLGLPSLAVPVPDSSTSTPLPLPHPTPKRPSLTQSAAPSHIHSSRSIHKPHPPPPAPRRAVRRHASSGAGGVSLLGNGGPAAEERYVFKGKIDIVDMEVVVNPAVCQEEGEERRFEVLSPEGSFVVYTGQSSSFAILSCRLFPVFPIFPFRPSCPPFPVVAGPLPPLPVLPFPCFLPLRRGH